jgi:hypothetical protein
MRLANYPVIPIMPGESEDFGAVRIQAAEKAADAVGTAAAK